MLSKPVAALLLVVALFGAAVGGAYIAIKVFQPDPADPDAILLEPESQGGQDATADPGATPSGGGAGRAPRPRPAPLPRPAGAAPAGGGAGGANASAPGAVASAPAAGGSSTPGASGGADGPPKGEPTFEEVEVPTDTLIGVRLQAALSSESAKVEDRVEARVTKDVAVRGVNAIPAGSLVVGSVTAVDKGGPMSGRARLDVKFHTIRILHAPEVPIVVDAIPQEGPSPAKGTKGRVVGGAAGGAALGWLKGGISGAIAGSAIGGGAGVGARMVEGRQPAEIPAGAETQLQLRAPAFVTVQR
jgi:hypothetical protein